MEILHYLEDNCMKVWNLLPCQLCGRKVSHSDIAVLLLNWSQTFHIDFTFFGAECWENGYAFGRAHDGRDDNTPKDGQNHPQGIYNHWYITASTLYGYVCLPIMLCIYIYICVYLFSYYVCICHWVWEQKKNFCLGLPRTDNKFYLVSFDWLILPTFESVVKHAK